MLSSVAAAEHPQHKHDPSKSKLHPTHCSAQPLSWLAELAH